MKSIKLYSILLIILTVLSCSSDNNDENGDDLANATSKQGCNTVTGSTAIYWDYANGIPAPLNRIPILANPGVRFTHAQHPYLSIEPPQDYTATEVLDPQTAPLGVKVLRNDNTAIWKYIPLSSFPIGTSVNNIIAREVNGMLNAFGFQNFDTLLCSSTRPINQQSGLDMTFSARIGTFGNFTGLVYVIVTKVPGLPVSVAVSVSAGPTNEFNNLVMDVFLPLSFQLLVIDRGGLSDRDGDGTPDIFDREPDNPNVQ